MKKRVIIFILALAALLAFQYKVVVPYVYDVASSDLFLEDSGDESNRISSETLMTEAAFQQCNSYIANELAPDQTFTFPEKPINAFSLGSYRYIVNADLEITPQDAAMFIKRYACRIKYENGDDTTGLSDIENWSIDGISGLDNL
ncbi:MAG: hypothetical protein KAR12_18305 [Methylococcales bacterium]|nr:hypothetical protein [Methylococcales bacterium]